MTGLETRDQLIIPQRFNGPQTSANGGWTGGSLAKRLQATSVTASLKSPPPLDTPMAVTQEPDGAVGLRFNQSLVALAHAETFDLALPTLPNFEEASVASQRAFAQGQKRLSWPYSKCFACGVAHGSGLCITPGPIASSGHHHVIAALWTPASTFNQDKAQEDVAGQKVCMEAIWAALDCPAGIAWSYRLPEGQPMVTVRMSVAIEAAPVVGETYIVMGWPIAQEGRKLHAGTALASLDGRILARSLQLWLLPKPS